MPGASGVLGCGRPSHLFKEGYGAPWPQDSEGLVNPRLVEGTQVSPALQAPLRRHSPLSGCLKWPGGLGLTVTLDQGKCTVENVLREQEGKVRKRKGGTRAPGRREGRKSPRGGAPECSLPVLGPWGGTPGCQH